MSLIDTVHSWMKQPEGTHLEFKEAKNSFETGKLAKYCCALANEKGGHLILGITDMQPRIIVGTKAFENLETTKSDLSRRLPFLRIEIDEVFIDGLRVLVFSIPSRPIGMPIQYEDKYWMRCGEEVVSMTPDMLKRIFDEGVPDFSAKICPQVTVQDLDKDAIQHFREMWVRKSGNSSLKNISDEQLLESIEAIDGERVTYAALILFGTPKALSRHLAQAEVIFEYRSGHTVGPAQQRIEYRQSFFSFYNELWEKINLRNDIQHFQDGLFIWDVPTFNEKAIREAILNAISHRDYRAPGSIWVKQYPRKIVISSPGGFPQGISPENILWKQQPRNRRIAEIFGKCGLVERAGQGADRIFEESIREGKPLPDFAHTDEHEVVLALDGEIQDEAFLRFLEKIGQEKLASFTTTDFLVLDLVHKERSIPSNPPEFKIRLQHLIDMGVVERIGRGRDVRYLLCQQFYAHTGKSGVYTRKIGLDKETNKELLLKHIRSNARKGASLKELCQVLPALSTSQVQKLMRELKDEAKVILEGRTKSSLWFLKTDK